MASDTVAHSTVGFWARFVLPARLSGEISWRESYGTTPDGVQN
jgi:hypothetical protein